MAQKIPVDPEPAEPAAPPAPAADRRPARRPEFTLRAVLVAMVVAALMGGSYPLIVLKLGFGPSIWRNVRRPRLR